MSLTASNILCYCTSLGWGYYLVLIRVLDDNLIPSCSVLPLRRSLTTIADVDECNQHLPLALVISSCDNYNCLFQYHVAIPLLHGSVDRFYINICLRYFHSCIASQSRFLSLMYCFVCYRIYGLLKALKFLLS